MTSEAKAAGFGTPASSALGAAAAADSYVLAGVGKGAVDAVVAYREMQGRIAEQRSTADKMAGDIAKAGAATMSGASATKINLPAPVERQQPTREFLREANREASTALAVAKSGPEPWDGTDPSTKQQDAMRDIAKRTGMDGLYATAPMAPELAERARFQQAATSYAKEGAARIPDKAPPPALSDKAPGPDTTGGLRGWANPATQRAAQEARRRSGN